MTGSDLAKRVRKINQHYSYAAIQMHETIGRKAGLPGTDHKYLGFMIQKGQMTAGELATLTGLTTGAVTGLIDRFEKKKLVKREFAADDRRKVFIVPDTKKIMALMQPLYREFRSKSEKIISSFSNDELKVIERFLGKTVDLMIETTNKHSKK